MFIELHTLHSYVIKLNSMNFRANWLNIFKISLKITILNRNVMFILELKVLMFAFTMFVCIN